MSERAKILRHFQRAVRTGARRRVAAEAIGIDLRTLQRWQRDLRDDGRRNNRFAQSNALSKEERQAVIDTACSPEFRDQSPTQIVPILAEQRRYIASESTFYRLLRTAGLLKHRSPARAPERGRPDAFVATGPNQVWSWDISLLRSMVGGAFFRLYLFMDIWDRSIVGWRLEESEAGLLAAELLNDICEKHSVEPGSLVVHQDNGSAMTSWEFLAALYHWGDPSYSRPGVCDDNPYSESLFKTMKYRPGYPRTFQSIDETREWVAAFVEWYNNHHRHSAIGYVTPLQRRTGEDYVILENRREAYAEARSAHPERWSGKPRAWTRPESVSLNPTHRKKSGRKKAA